VEDEEGCYARCWCGEEGGCVGVQERGQAGLETGEAGVEAGVSGGIEA